MVTRMYLMRTYFPTGDSEIPTRVLHYVSKRTHFHFPRSRSGRDKKEKAYNGGAVNDCKNFPK